MLFHVAAKALTASPLVEDIVYVEKVLDAELVGLSRSPLAYGLPSRPARSCFTTYRKHQSFSFSTRNTGRRSLRPCSNR